MSGERPDLYRKGSRVEEVTVPMWLVTLAAKVLTMEHKPTSNKAK
jgi:hypothetical protein